MLLSLQHEVAGRGRRVLTRLARPEAVVEKILYYSAVDPRDPLVRQQRGSPRGGGERGIQRVAAQRDVFGKHCLAQMRSASLLAQETLALLRVARAKVE